LINDNAPNKLHVDDFDPRNGKVKAHLGLDGKWHRIRPVDNPMFIARLRLAWAVFRGEADALFWPPDEK
jgi:hypothetical protein